jgi:phosphohistidine phosphatase
MGGPDHERPLSEKGQADIERVAAWAARNQVHVTQIWQSGRRRAEQTAGILEKHLSPTGGAVPVPGLGPNDDVEPIADAIQLLSEPLMLVGHLPFMSRLTSLLLVGNPDRDFTEFPTGTIVCLEQEHQQWLLAWIISPDFTK